VAREGINGDARGEAFGRMALDFVANDLTMSKRDRFPYRADVHGRLIAAAIDGRTIAYSDLGTGRGWVGSYLFRIAHEEDAAGRPPLTSIVVHKTDRRPGPGMLEAMEQIDYARPDEREADVWNRALADVFAYWRGKSADEVLRTWRPALGESQNTWPRFRNQ
jgi:hypothetical protein